MKTKLNIGIVTTLTQMLLKETLMKQTGLQQKEKQMLTQVFKIFLRLIERPLKKNVPGKKTSRKKQTLDQNGNYTFTKIRDITYQIKSLPNQQNKKAAFKKYQNKITNVLLIRIQYHYQKNFIRVLWQGIHEIICLQLDSNPQLLVL